MGETRENLALLQRLRWQDFLFVLSIDATFLWSCVIGLGDFDFQLIDPYFLLQMQFRLVGIFILSWALSVVLANAIRLILSFQTLRVLRFLFARRTYRFIMRKWVLECGTFALLLVVSLIENPLYNITKLFLMLFAASVILYFFGGIITGQNGFERRLARKVEMASTQRSEDLRVNAAYRVDNLKALKVLNIAIKAFTICFAIVIGLSHAEKLKGLDKSTLKFDDLLVHATIVGQTGFGYLIWQHKCACLSVAGYGQVEMVTINSK